jgi:peptidoglycan/LPS O-acetylase OafA/YrhL
MVAFIPTKHLPKILGILLVLSSMYKYIFAFHSDVIAYSTFSVMSDLVIGCLLGYVAVERKKLYEKWKSIPKALVVLAYAGILLLIIGRHWYLPILYPYKSFYALSVMLAPLALASLFALAIFEQNESPNSLFKAGRSRLTSSLGRISYGLYSYHMIAFALVLALAANFSAVLSYDSFIRWVILGLVSLSLTVLLAYSSFRHIESRVLSKKPL